MIKIFKNLRSQEWALIALVMVFIVLQVWLDLTMPDYMADITRMVQTDGSTMSEMLTAGGKMLLCALGSLLAAVLLCSEDCNRICRSVKRKIICEGAVIFNGRNWTFFNGESDYAFHQ